ncbi:MULTISPECIES: phycobiliprotein lyase [Cyanophyceae]|uniref:phycobiliprotein lyase n=1 Tax=Cyanophyceae TaxID=3028117 RepID=UPI001688217E|nr:MULTISPECIES: phycobiliprotein lyase [Cyanophyceae]MBD1917587.1 phycobiliprotein lyase [Phormidium sp. FACHB-77]MBD2029538.1 phycobiliprotein lyase [Phormidium sp. FACHB-322]MBD2050799.1 phycobiliprotein lyase [Leptolyngbya sp. FACHB-60]
MPLSADVARLLAEPLVQAFFQETAGDWRSERRYYTLKSGETQEVVSQITIAFLEPGTDQLLELANLHQLDPQKPLICGTTVTWESEYMGTGKKPVAGSTIFGVRGTTLYRDRGFATSKPVTAQYHFNDSRTLVLKTQYNDSSFEEELRLIGQRYRTRQTVISRAGEQIMIGQYLETRL